LFPPPPVQQTYETGCWLGWGKKCVSKQNNIKIKKGSIGSLAIPLDADRYLSEGSVETNFRDPSLGIFKAGGEISNLRGMGVTLGENFPLHNPTIATASPSSLQNCFVVTSEFS
jgi:hypothetical protein